jgi:hypothetical protein
MLHEFGLAVEFFARFDEGDWMLAGWVAQRGCSHNAGPLHQGHQERKPWVHWSRRLRYAFDCVSRFAAAVKAGVKAALGRCCHPRHASLVGRSTWRRC